MGVVFSQATSDRIRVNSLEPGPGEVQIGHQGEFLHGKHWNGLSMEIVESPCLDEFKKWLDMALSAMVKLIRWRSVDKGWT